MMRRRRPSSSIDAWRSVTHASIAGAGGRTVPRPQLSLGGAVAAARALRVRADIDLHRVFVLGHSQGGTFAPKIAVTDPRIAGIILLAAGAAPFGWALLRQATYLSNLPGEIGTQARAQLPTIQDFVRQIVRRVASSPLGIAGIVGGIRGRGRSPAAVGSGAAYQALRPLNLRGDCRTSPRDGRAPRVAPLDPSRPCPRQSWRDRSQPRRQTAPPCAGDDSIRPAGDRRRPAGVPEVIAIAVRSGHRRSWASLPRPSSLALDFEP